MFSEVDNGTIEVSVSASGKVVPAFEEIINSPINTRILKDGANYIKIRDIADVLGYEVTSKGSIAVLTKQ